MASEAAECAKAIKKELKASWPTVKFSVKSEYYAGGNSVHVSWCFGPTSKQVDAIIRKYQHGHFDGMTDCYNYSETTTAHSAKYVSGQREIPYEIVQQVQQDYAAALGVAWQGQATRWGDSYISDLTYRLLAVFELPHGYQGIAPVADTQQACFLEEHYELIGGIRQARH